MSTANDNRPETITITMLPIDQLDPNPWNPNELTDEQRAELLAEVRRLGKVPKPVVARPNGERFEIVDGEHNWKAAKECGLTQVPCEVVELDDYTARLETFKRNQHGQHDRVHEGKMFRKMLKLRKISQRKLAAESGISEATLRRRNSLEYALAADLRNEHFREHGCRSPFLRQVEPDGIISIQIFQPGHSVRFLGDVDPEKFSPVWVRRRCPCFRSKNSTFILHYPAACVTAGLTLVAS